VLNAVPAHTQRRILVVDDDILSRRTLTRTLSGAGFEVEAAEDGVSALARLESQPFDLVLTDIEMPRADGFSVLRGARKIRPGMPVIVMTARRTVQECVDAMKAGARDFVTKPFHSEELLKAVRELAVEPATAPETEPASARGRETATAAKGKANVQPVAALRSFTPANGDAPTHPPARPSLEKQRWETPVPTRPARHRPAAIIGDSNAWRTTLRTAQDAAPTDTTVLLVGESGTGKEVVARLIHSASARAGQPFVAFNCGAIPPDLVESELFGHKRGSFSGATADHRGHFAEANGGTVFLDEVGELPAEHQVKLLRVLQEREIKPVGAPRPVAIDVRVIAATNRDLEEMVARGQFRQDLFYRLDVMRIQLPPLRDRPQDIGLLARHFLASHSARLQRPVELSAEAEALLLGHAWPGNVRELENALERAAIVARTGVIHCDHLPSRIARANGVGRVSGAVSTLRESGHIDLPSTLARIEWQLISEALSAANGNKTKAARALGIRRTTLNDKIERLRPNKRPTPDA